MSTSTADHPGIRRQTTVLIGGSNGTKTLCALLGDSTNPANAGHTIRVVTRHPGRFLEDGSVTTGPGKKIVEWRCREQRAVSDLVPTSWMPTRWVCHVGRPHCVLGYSDDNDNDADNNSGGSAVGAGGGDDPNEDDDMSVWTPLERAISGIGTNDDGGAADCLVLCCPVYAHGDILRQIARALYRLERRGGSSNVSGSGMILRSTQPPLLIGSLYAAGGFDWVCRKAFATERPSTGFTGWKRPMALWGLRSFPYLCKSLEKGHVTLYGRYPSLGVVVSPCTPEIRGRTRIVLERVLQCHDAKYGNGKPLGFLGLGSDVKSGGDGGSGFARMDDEYVGISGSSPSSSVMMLRNTAMTTAAAGAAAALATAASATDVGTGKAAAAAGGGSAVVVAEKTTSSAAAASAAAAAAAAKATYVAAPSGILEYTPAHCSSSSNKGGRRAIPPYRQVSTPIMSDLADPYGSLGFLACTMNATNQILHPCIMASLFDDIHPTKGHNMGAILDWDPKHRPTPFPRFYADGACKLSAGKLIVAISVGELYPVMALLDRVLSPNGYLPISGQHGGEPVGRYCLTEMGNHPLHVTTRSGLLDDRGHLPSMSSSSSSKNTLLPLPPTTKIDIRDKVNYYNMCSRIMSYGLSRNTRLGSVLAPCIRDETTGVLTPNVQTRFFIDDVPHGLCVALGLGELLGMNLERDMEHILGLVRKLQRWMGKEYVIPEEQWLSRGGGGGGGWMGCGGGIVGGARDVLETSAPQAFGIRNLDELKVFLSSSLFGEIHRKQEEGCIEGDRGASDNVAALTSSPKLVVPQLRSKL